MTDEEREVMRSLLECAEETIWHFEDNPTDRNVCYSCGATHSASRPWPFRPDDGWMEHKPGCKLRALLDRARALVDPPPVQMVECLRCKRPESAVNWVPGHIFVGWGHGWQPCAHCGGSTLVPAP